MKKCIITISREFGSGGRTIGREVAEKLGIPCYDEEIINKVAKESGLTENYIRESGEYAVSSSWLDSVLSGRDFNGHALSDDVWKMQSDIIEKVAEEGSCVIVGRCADYILKGKTDCLNVFIHASIEQRADRIVHVYGERDDSPEKRLHDKDKRRKTYYQYYTDMKWGDYHNYQLVLDSGALGIEQCVEIITMVYNNKQ